MSKVKMPPAKEIVKEIKHWIESAKQRLPEQEFLLKFREEPKGKFWYQLMLRAPSGELICQSTQFPVNEGWIPVELFWFDPRRHWD